MLERRLERERVIEKPLERERGVARGLEKQRVRKIRLEGERVRQKQPSRGVLSKKSSKICSKFTGEQPYQSVIQTIRAWS